MILRQVEGLGSNSPSKLEFQKVKELKQSSVDSLKMTLVQVKRVLINNLMILTWLEELERSRGVKTLMH